MVGLTGGWGRAEQLLLGQTSGTGHSAMGLTRAPLAEARECWCGKRGSKGDGPCDVQGPNGHLRAGLSWVCILAHELQLPTSGKLAKLSELYSLNLEEEK